MEDAALNDLLTDSEQQLTERRRLLDERFEEKKRKVGAGMTWRQVY